MPKGGEREKNMDPPVQCFKYIKLNNDPKNGDGEDIISKLPDCILNYILSFIPYKESVRTSILSTRWQHLWTSAANIDFNNLFESKALLLNFVERALLLHDTSAIKRFRLRFHGPVEPSRINSWISALVKHNVEELGLLLRVETNFLLPCCLFTCESLSELRLDLKSVWKVPTSVKLPNLKKLSLSSVILLEDSIERLLSTCQVLEELCFQYCHWLNIKRIKISIPSLKRFTFIRYKDSWDKVTDCEIEIHASSLVSLYYESDFSCACILYDVPSSVNASVDISNLREEVIDRALRLLNHVPAVKSLAVTGNNELEAGDMADRITTLYKLTTLKLQLEVTSETTRNLMNFLLKAPILEFLDITIKYPYEEVDLDENWEVDVIPCCFGSHLKTINITFFNGYKEEMLLLEHVLRHAAVLERMVVTPREDLFSNPEMLNQVENQLQMFPRSSENCVVELLQSDDY